MNSILELKSKLNEYNDFTAHFSIGLPVKDNILDMRSYKYPFDYYSCYLRHDGRFSCKQNVDHIYLHDDIMKVMDILENQESFKLDLSKIDTSLYDINTNEDHEIEVKLSLGDIGYSYKSICINLELID